MKKTIAIALTLIITLLAGCNGYKKEVVDEPIQRLEDEQQDTQVPDEEQPAASADDELTQKESELLSAGTVLEDEEYIYVCGSEEQHGVSGDV